MYYVEEHTLLVFLVQVLLLLGLCRGLGEVFRRWKQPTVTADILVGIVLGPTLLGRVAPEFQQVLFPRAALQQSMLETVAWLGLLFLLLDTGLAIDFRSAWRQRNNAVIIAVSGLIVPMMMVAAPMAFLAHRYLGEAASPLFFVLFVGMAMTISALPVAVRVLQDLNIFKSDLGFLIVSALMVNDIIGWIMFTILLGLFLQGQFEAYRVAFLVGATGAFTLFCFTLGRRGVERALTFLKEKDMPEPGASITFILLLGMVCGAATIAIGMHALFGFFIAGIMAGGARALSENSRQIINQMVYAIFVPLFFANIGLKIDFLGNFDVFLAVLITVVGIAGRFLGPWLGVFLTRHPRENQYTIAIAHTAGGEMQIVVSILALEFKLITSPVFVAVVFAALVSSIVMGPWLAYSLRRRERVRVSDFLAPDLVIDNLAGRTRERAIGTLCTLASSQAAVAPGEDVCEAVLARERQLGTAMEEGVAIPHARLRTLERPVIAFGRSISGIDWNSPDAEPARFIFLILTPEKRGDVQVQIIGAIARAMSSARVRDALQAAGDKKELYNTLRRALLYGNLPRRRG
ncbi:MAG: cation:proton antiporter [Candidatus Hydrogenedentes bacterium]|nr:cation:proton antiporter [Candidatus Hydrogenedentota bacterium]